MSQGNETVSVIMPAYNCADFVEESIDSVLAQDYPHIEILVIDDGSTDNTADVLKAYGPKITVLHQSNGGAAAARNFGMSRAKGDYICFLDTDDVWHPQKISGQVNYLRAHPEVLAMCSDWQVWEADEAGNFSIPDGFMEQVMPEKPETEFEGWIYPQLLLESALHTISVMLRRSLVEQLGDMDVSLINGEDYDYWLRASRLTEIHKITDNTALYRIREGSLVRRVHQRNYELDVLERALDQWGRKSPDGKELPLPKLKERLASLHYNFAYMHYHFGDSSIALESARKALANQPSSLAGWKLYLRAQLKRIVR